MSKITQGYLGTLLVSFCKPQFFTSLQVEEWVNTLHQAESGQLGLSARAIQEKYLRQLSKAITIAKTMKSKIHQTPDYDQKNYVKKRRDNETQGHTDNKSK